jgi:hypothetical protein
MLAPRRQVTRFGELLPISEMGQKAKYSLRRDVFRFAPESGHRAMQSGCPFRANKRHSSVTERTRSLQTGRPGSQLTGADREHKVRAMARH